MGIGKKTAAALALVISCALMSTAYAADEKQKDINTSANAPTTAPAADDKLLDAVAPLVGGEWKIKATWAAGNPLEARAVYSWGVGRKFIEAKTFVSSDKGEYQRYHNIFGVHDGRLNAWQFTFDGHAETLIFTIDGKKLSSTRVMKATDGSDATLHQSIELIEPNKLHWIVQIEQNQQLKPLMDGYWVRESAASARQ